MPRLDVTTKKSEKVWSTPDGQRSIYKLTLEYEGQPVQAKTYSDAIAREGWAGTVETYEKTGKNGPETFVKQPPKEGYTAGGGSSKPAYQPRDDAAIKAQFAIKAAVQALPEAKADSLSDYVSDVEALAQGFFEMVDRVKAVQEPDKQPADGTGKDEVHTVPDDDIDTSKIDEIFGGDADAVAEK